MPKHNMEKKDEKDRLTSFLKEMNQKEEISEEEMKELNELIQQAILKRSSRKAVFFRYLRLFSFQLILFFLISVLSFSFFLNHVVLTNKFHIFYAALAISLLFTFIEGVAAVLSKRSIILYGIALLLMVVDFCILNQMLPIFDFTSLWVIYFIVFVILYGFFISYLFKRKFKG